MKYENGLIKVGPQSAGADPGPLCYDQGGKIVTITDVDLAFGVLPEKLAGGRKLLDKQLALNGLQKFSEETKIDLSNLLVGIRRIFHENIAGAIRSVSTQRGYDPREFALLAFGGAGPVHGVEIAEVMGMKKVIIPPFPGIWSSVGLLGGDYEYSTSQGLVRDLENISEEEINSIFEELKIFCDENAKRDGITKINEKYIGTLSLRFIGQSFELVVPYSNKESARLKFLEMHRYRYGFAAENEPIEIVALNFQLIIPHPNPKLPRFKESKSEDTNLITRKVGEMDCLILNKNELKTKFQYDGPKIIQQDDTTIFVPEHWIFQVDELGFIHITKE